MKHAGRVGAEQLVFRCPLMSKSEKMVKEMMLPSFFSDFMMCGGCVGLNIFILDQIGSIDLIWGNLGSTPSSLVLSIWIHITGYRKGFLAIMAFQQYAPSRDHRLLLFGRCVLSQQVNLLLWLIYV